ncbi:HAD family hydrolase [Persephonella sp.]
MDRQNYKKISGIQTEIKDKELFIFDLDGTVIDSSKDIADAVNFTLQELGYPVLPEEKIIKHVGYGGKKLMEGVLNTTDEQLIKKAVSIFRDYYFRNPAEKTTLYPYVEELLRLLKDRRKKIAIVTNKYEDISRRILESLKILNIVDFLVGGDSVEKKKPDPMPILHAVNRLSSNIEKTVMIGDSEADIQAGKGAGVFTVYVTYGFGKEEVVLKYDPDLTVNSAREILSILA